MMITKEQLIQIRETLEEAERGLKWFHEAVPAYYDGSDDEAMERITASLASLQSAIDAPEQELTSLDITIDDDDALAFLRDMVVQDDGELTPIRLLVGGGHSGHGLYVASADYPEEGAVLVHAMTAPQPSPPTSPVMTITIEDGVWIRNTPLDASQLPDGEHKLYVGVVGRDPLTEARIEQISDETGILYVSSGCGDYGSNSDAIIPFARAIESAHNIK